MRKIDGIVLGLAVAGGFSLAACGSSGNETPIPAENEAVEAAVPANPVGSLNAADDIEQADNQAAAIAPVEDAKAEASVQPPAENAADEAKAPEAVTASVERPAAFAICATCHSTGEGEAHRIGPNLFAVVGSKAGSKPGYAYSDAMKSSSITWSPTQLREFILAPGAMVPGTKMMMGGAKDEKTRSEIVKYLSSLK